MPRSTDSRASSGKRVSAKNRRPELPALENGTAVTAAGERSVAAGTIQNSTIVAGDQYPLNVVLSEAVYGRLREQDFLPPLFASIALSLIADVARRFFDDSHWLETAITILQPILIASAAVAGVLACVSLFRPAHPLAEKGKTRLFGKRVEWKKANVVTGIALAAAIALKLSLPFIAHLYNERGFQLQRHEPRDVSGAREAFERALRLAPGYSAAHYNLAVVYEDLHDENAIKEYLLAIKYDSRLYAAYNNLARLYLQRHRENDYENALTILEEARELSPQDENVQYSLNKNLGWVHYELKHYPLAETYLRRAIFLRGEDAAAAHCLMAYVLKEQGKPGVADECYDCVSLAPGEKDVEAKWLRDAQECVMNGGNK